MSLTDSSVFVCTQIKVRDFSRAQVNIQPAEFGSWSEARNELMVEAKVSANLQPLTPSCVNTLCS